jgi:hypothetical protein
VRKRSGFHAINRLDGCERHFRVPFAPALRVDESDLRERLAIEENYNAASYSKVDSLPLQAQQESKQPDVRADLSADTMAALAGSAFTTSQGPAAAFSSSAMPWVSASPSVPRPLIRSGASPRP